MNPTPPNNADTYDVESILGKGGMGVVYLAHDKRLNRKVAIKCIRQNRANDLWVEAVQEEAKLLAQINHTNIVQIYDLIDWHGVPALVMEYVCGRTLLDILNSDDLHNHSIDFNQRLDWLKQIAQGLASAHAKGIIHRDLKPENIMIATDGTVKIMDFGIARHQAQPKHTNIHDSQVLPGEFVGSPGSLSPEQALGEDLTTASDMFSFGILAYSLLCGHHPFGDTGDSDTLLHGIIYNEPLSLKLLHGLEGDAEKVSACILDCLNKTASKRPSAQGCLTKLKIEHKPIAPPDPIQHINPPSNKLWSAAFVGALVLIGYGLFHLLKNEPIRYVAILSPIVEVNGSTDENTQAMASTALSDTLYQRLIALESVNLVDPSDWDNATDLKTIFASSGATHVITPRLTCSLHKCDLSMSLHIRNGDKHQLASQQRWQIIADSMEDIYLTTWQHASNLMESNRTKPDAISAEDYDTYLTLLRQYLNTTLLTDTEFEQLAKLTEKTPLFAPAMRLRTRAAISQYQDNNNSNQLAPLSKMLDQQRTSLPVADYLEQKTQIYIALTDFAAAERLLQELRIVGSNYQYHELHADILLRQNRFEQAIVQLRLLLNIRTSIKTLYSLAYSQYAMGDLTGAEKTLQELLQRSPENIRAKSFLAGLSMTQGKYQQAINAYQSLTAEKPHPLDLNNLAIAYMLIGDYSTAEIVMQQALGLSPNQPLFLNQMGETQLAQGKDAAAEYYFQLALKNLKNTQDISDYILGATANLHLNNLPEAEKHLIQASSIEANNAGLVYTQALQQTKLGHNEKALALIHKSLNNGYSQEWFSFPWFSALCQNASYIEMFPQAGHNVPCFKSIKPEGD